MNVLTVATLLKEQVTLEETETVKLVLKQSDKKRFKLFNLSTTQASDNNLKPAEWLKFFFKRAQRH